MVSILDTQMILKNELKNIGKEKLNPQNIGCLLNLSIMKCV
jgi:hypothetical protein